MLHPPQRIRKKPLAEINVVPYIDVMLVLLVIFMITAPLLNQGIHVHLPKTSGKALPQSDSLMIITIDPKGRYYLNIAAHPKTPLSLDALIPLVSKHWQSKPKKYHQQDIYIKGDRAITYGIVVQLMGLLKRAGIAHIGLITQNPTTESKHSDLPLAHSPRSIKNEHH